MTTALNNDTPQRHPWLAVLEASPKTAVSDFLAGYADIFPLTRADAPDAARMLVGQLDAGDPALEAFEEGMISWLNAARMESLPTDPARLQDRIRQISEAFEIISLLKLRKVALMLRQQYIRWFEWVGRLVLTPSRDARASYCRMLAITQITVANDVSDPDSLSAFWMRVCKDAGSVYPKSYLQIGLLGLRRLPDAIKRGDSPWIAGLAAWAHTNDPSDKDFLRAWLPVKRLHPASPKVLKKRVFDVLSQKTFKDADIASPEWWAADPDFPKVQDTHGRRHSFQPPALELTQTLIDDLKNDVPFSDVKPRLEALVFQYENFVRVTGDHYGLVRTFRNVGNWLLKTAKSHRFERAEFAKKLARKSLAFEPYETLGWALWRESLYNAGFTDAAIALGWESVRRFPDEPFLRHELAEILIAVGQTIEAQDLLEDSVESNAHSHVIFSTLSRLYLNTGKTEAARKAILDGLAMEPEDGLLLHSLDVLDRGDSVPLVAASRLNVPSAPESIPEEFRSEDSLVQDLGRSGTLRSMRQRLRHHDAETVNALKDTLATDPTFGYAQILAARHKLWRAADTGLPDFAAAFEEALAHEDLDKLKTMTEQMPRLRSLILLAQAILGDSAAAAKVADLLRSEDMADHDGVAIRILRPRFRQALRLIDGGMTPVEAVARCEQQLRLAIYDTNEAVSAPDLMAA